MDEHEHEHEQAAESDEAASHFDDGHAPRRAVVFESEERLDVTVVEDSLERAGLRPAIAKRVQGTGTLLSVSVEEPDAEQARQVVAAIMGDPSPSAEPTHAKARIAGKRATLAWGLALVPGMAHIYAGATNRGLLLFATLLSTFYWTAIDHTTVMAKFALMLVDALGASALISGQLKPVRVWLVRTAPLWVAAPALLLLGAPPVYIGAAGRAFCESAASCGVDFGADTCSAVLAGQIGSSIRYRRAIGDCARFLETRTCDEAYGGTDDTACETPPLCAQGRTDGEDACVQVYYGLPVDRVGPTFRAARPRGWGM